jgi:hypothetical protein
MVMKLGHFGKKIKKNWKVLPCGAEEGYRRSVGPIVRETEVLQRAQ